MKIFASSQRHQKHFCDCFIAQQRCANPKHPAGIFTTTPQKITFSFGCNQKFFWRTKWTSVDDFQWPFQRFPGTSNAKWPAAFRRFVSDASVNVLAGYQINNVNLHLTSDIICSVGKHLPALPCICAFPDMILSRPDISTLNGHFYSSWVHGSTSPKKKQLEKTHARPFSCSNAGSQLVKSKKKTTLLKHQKNIKNGYWNTCGILN